MLHCQKMHLHYLVLLFLFYYILTATWPSGKAEACKAFIPQFESGCRLFLLQKIANHKSLKYMESMELNQFWEQVKAEFIKALPENAHPWIYPLEVSGYDKQKVGQIASQIRAVREPEPYLGKGIKYKDEVILRKEGKRSSKK